LAVCINEGANDLFKLEMNESKALLVCKPIFDSLIGQKLAGDNTYNHELRTILKRYYFLYSDSLSMLDHLVDAE
jgi:hypothetical protein